MRQRSERAELVDSQIAGLIKSTFNEMTGAGAISLATLTTYITSTGADALTLADGEEGQLKIIVHAVDGGTSTITPANFGGVTSVSIALALAGESIILQFLKGNWWLLSRSSTATVTGLPVVA